MNVIYSNTPKLTRTRTLRRRRPYTPPSPVPPGETSTVFSLFDRECYIRDVNGLWLVYKDGSRQRIDSSPLSFPSVDNPNRSAFGLEDLMIAMFVLLLIAAISFITVIAF